MRVFVTSEVWEVVRHSNPGDFYLNHIFIRRRSEVPAGYARHVLGTDTNRPKLYPNLYADKMAATGSWPSVGRRRRRTGGAEICHADMTYPVMHRMMAGVGDRRDSRSPGHGGLHYRVAARTRTTQYGADRLSNQRFHPLSCIKL